MTWTGAEAEEWEAIFDLRRCAYKLRDRGHAGDEDKALDLLEEADRRRQVALIIEGRGHDGDIDMALFYAPQHGPSDDGVGADGDVGHEHEHKHDPFGIGSLKDDLFPNPLEI